MKAKIDNNTLTDQEPIKIIVKKFIVGKDDDGNNTKEFVSEKKIVIEDTEK